MWSTMACHLHVSRLTCVPRKWYLFEGALVWLMLLSSLNFTGATRIRGIKGNLTTRNNPQDGISSYVPFDSFKETPQHRMVQAVGRCPNLDDVFNPLSGICTTGNEFGEECIGDSECFTKTCLPVTNREGQSLGQVCGCAAASECLGCTSDAAVCVRVEQIHPFQPMKLCQIAVARQGVDPDIFGNGKGKGKGNRRKRGGCNPIRSDDDFFFKVYSVGGRHRGIENHTGEDFFDYDVYFSIWENTFLPFIEGHTNETKALLPPAFVQGNVKTTNQSDIGWIVLSGELDSFIDAVLFLGHNWVDNIDFLESETNRKKGKSKKKFGERGGNSKMSNSRNSQRRLKSKLAKSKGGGSGDTIAVEVWDRVEVENVTVIETLIDALNLTEESLTNEANPAAMHILNVEENESIVWNTSIPTGFGIEFIGRRNASQVQLQGFNLTNEGRLSFKDLSVSFEDAMLALEGSTIFQFSTLDEFDRCPVNFQDFGILCFLVVEPIDFFDDAVSNCARFKRGFLPTYENLEDPEEIATTLLQFYSEVWLANAPPLFDSNGSLLQPAPDCSYLTREGDQGTMTNCSGILKPVLCASTIKDPIIGQTWTNYNSKVNLGSHYSMFNRLVNDSQLPVQLNGVVTTPQLDLIDKTTNEAQVFSVSDERPTVIKVAVDVAYGDVRDVVVAFDSFDSPVPFDEDLIGYEWNVSEDTDALPSKMQLHTNSSLPVCIRQVDIFFRNQTETDHLAIRIPASLFSECTEWNVCSQDMTNLCGRSLLFYDTEFNCAVLQTGRANYPRDLAINLFESSCARLTTWAHPALGEPFYIHADRDVEPSKALLVRTLISSVHQYSFPPGTNTLQLDEANTLPVDMVMQQGSGARANAVRISRYGLNKMSVNFTSLWSCINVCSAVATREGLVMGNGKTIEAYLNLIEQVDCRKLPLLFTDGEVTGREACTTPPLNNSTIDGIRTALAQIANPDQPFRTLYVNVTSSFEAPLGLFDAINLPEKRGLTMEVDDGYDNVANFTGIHFGVHELSELTLEGMTLRGDVMVTVSPLATFEAAGVIVTRFVDNQDIVVEPFLINQGDVLLSTAKIRGQTVLQNLDRGLLDLVYVDFFDQSNIKNSGSMRISRLKVHDDFVRLTDLDSTYYPEGTRRSLALDQFDQLCNSSQAVAPDQRVFGGYSTCQDTCDNAIVCTGMLLSFDDESFQPVCDLCLREEPCIFDCSQANAVYLKPESNFNFIQLSVCPVFPRELEVLLNVTLEECKMFCNYYRSCEGFEFKSESNTSECILNADLDFDENCEEKSDVFIPFVIGDLKGYISIEAEPEDEIVIDVHRDLNEDSCAAACDKTLRCSSFKLTNGSCTLLQGNKFARVALNGTRLHVPLRDYFPRKRFMSLDGDHCRIENPSAAYTTKVRERCEAFCVQDLACRAYTFTPFQNHGVPNCEIHRKPSLVDGLFLPNKEQGCNVTVEVRIAFVAETSYVSTEGNFAEAHAVPNLLVDECKSLCLYDKNCIALRYNSSNAICSIGTLGVGNSTEPYMALKADTADRKSTYLSVFSCFEGEELDGVVTSQLQKPKGFAQTEGVCAQSPSIAKTLNTSRAMCNLECSLDPVCNAFLYNSGHCELLSGDISFGDCDLNGSSKELNLRAEIGSTCESLCNAHQRCIAYILDTTGRCRMFSDIAVLDQCSASTSQLLRLSKFNRPRDALIAASGQCFVEFEDTREIGCFGPIVAEDIGSPSDLDVNMTTPFDCQSTCRERSREFYAILDGSQCFCLDEAIHTSLTKVKNCTSPCAGDPNQLCGSPSAVLLGSTNLPKMGLTISQCKRECYESATCNAVLFSESVTDPPNNTLCEFKNSPLYIGCESSPGEAFVESLQHFYDTPLSYFNGDTVLKITTVDDVLDCELLCDYFLRCEAIRFDAVAMANNCEILGGSRVAVTAEDVVANVRRAYDVNLFTRGFRPDPRSVIASFANVFDLSECFTLCEEHARCGSVNFSDRVCTLHNKASFAQVSEGGPPIEQHYFVSYRSFVDPDQSFARAQDLCVNPNAVVIDKRVTTRSEYECAARCNRQLSCAVFTYNVENKRNCALYDGTARLVPPPTGENCTEGDSTFVMFRTAEFSRREGACLLNEEESNEDSSPTAFAFPGKSVAECAALCDEWFDCRSFRFNALDGSCRVFDSEQYSSATCPEGITGELFVYYSDFFFVILPKSICLSANTFLATLDDVPLEACKTICDKFDQCVAFEHNKDGQCLLASSSDFSSCTREDSRKLYISAKDVIDPNLPKFVYSPLANCFVTENTLIFNSQQECQENCTGTEECFGFQFNENTRECGIFSGTLPRLQECPDDGVSSFLRRSRNPYQKVEKACLRRKIAFSDRIFDTEQFECQALCNANSQCRYFLYGSDPNMADPDLADPAFRECILFKGQREQLDKCDGTPPPEYVNQTAFVNGRTFVDQITWFGEPESVFAVYKGSVSYQECASLCDLIDDCGAFLHPWNYRRFSQAETPQIFTRSRLIWAVYDPDGPTGGKALYLQADGNRLAVAESASDDDVRRQSIFLEPAVDGFRLRFWSDSGQCISGEAFSAIPQGAVRDIIVDNFNAIPVCQTLSHTRCESSDAVVLRIGEQERFITLEYGIPGTNEGAELFGCLFVRPLEGDPSFLPVTPEDRYGDLDFPSTIISETAQVNMTTTCTIVSTALRYQTPLEPGARRKLQELSEPAFTEYEVVENNCEQNDILVVINPTCATETIGMVDADTIEVKETCIFPPVETCTNVTETPEVITEPIQIEGGTIPTGSFVSDVTQTCTLEIVTGTVVRTERFDYDGFDVLQFITGHFETAPECEKQSTSTFDVLSRSYGRGCDFDNKIASFPSQEFDYASEAVALQNVATGFCLKDDLSMVDCSSGATLWTFTERGGYLFHVDTLGMMKCLTRFSDVPGSRLWLDDCTRIDRGIVNLQRWSYGSDDGTIRVFGTDGAACLSHDTVTGNAGLSSCIEPTARWDRFSECRLTTYSRTSPIKMEDFDKAGQCLNTNGSDLTDCSSAQAPFWRYYYEGSFARLERVLNDGGDSSMCLARVYDKLEETTSAIPLPNGVIPCRDENGEPRSDNIQFYRTELDGPEGNVFFFREDNLKYCVRIPSTSGAEECSAGLRDERNMEQAWRSFGSSSDATEISVKPEALRQEVTDLEVAYQLFLFSLEGKSSRILKAKTAELTREVRELLPVLLRVSGSVTELLDTIETITEPVDEIASRMKGAQKSFSIFAKVLIPFERIPYVGPAIKASNIRRISKAVGKRLKVGSVVLRRTDKTLDKLEFPIESFGAALNALVPSLENGIDSLLSLADQLTRAAFCAYRETLTDEFERMQEIIQSMLDAVKIALELLAGLENPLTILDKLKVNLRTNIKDAFDIFKSILDFLFDIISTFSWINDIVSFELCVSFPIVGRKCISLKAVGEFVESVINVIRKIPLVGYLVGVAESAVESVLGEIFKVLSFDLPDFGLSIGFIDDFLEEAEKAIQYIGDVGLHFDNILNFGGGIASRIEDLLEPITGILPDSLLELPCEDASCIADTLGIGIPDLDKLPLPDISWLNQQLSIPTGLFEPLENLLNNLDGFEDDLGVLVDGAACNKYEDIDINIVNLIAESFGKTPNDLNLGNCSFPLRVCVEPNFPNTEAFLEASRQRVESIFGTIARKRGLQQGGLCGDSTTFGFSVPFFIPSRLEDALLRLVVGNVVDARSDFWRHYDTAVGLVDAIYSRYKFGPVQISLSRFTPKIDIGCSNGKFISKLRIAPLFGLKVEIERPYAATAQAKLEIRDSELSSRQFQAESDVAFGVEALVCDFYFIAATLSVLTRFKDQVGPSLLRRFVDDIGEYFVELLATEAKSGRQGVAESLFLDISDSTGLESFEKYFKDIKKIAQRNRAIITPILASANITNDSRYGNVSKAPRLVYRKVIPEAGACAGPGIPDFRNLTLTDLKDNAKSFLEWALGFGIRFTPFDSPISTSIMSLGWRRQVLNANFERSETQASVSISAPFWFDEGGFAPPGLESLRLIPIVAIVSHFKQLFTDSKTRLGTVPNSQSSLMEALEAATDRNPSSKENYIIKNSVIISWDIGGVTINLSGLEETRRDDATFCGGLFCISFGK